LSSQLSAPYVDFCGEHFEIANGQVLTIGRDADLTLDDNPYLHRRFLEVSFRDSLVWLANVGGSTTATLADDAGLVQSWLSPGAQIPIVFPRTVVWFTAGPTTYEFEIVFAEAPFVARSELGAGDGKTTIGTASLTPEQRLLLLVLAEDILRRGNRGAGAIPPSSAAAARLGWTQTKFNRKLDTVCEKLSDVGVRGLVSDGRGAASTRRARLVEYALATRLITSADLTLLDGTNVDHDS
jgi:hypothetical protein